MKKTVLILGGAGYVGSYVAKRVWESGFNVVIVDDLSRGERSLARWGSFFEGKKGDPDLLKAVFRKHLIDAVMDFAAKTDVGESVLHPLLYYEDNVDETVRFLSFALDQGVSVYVFSSTATVYGNLPSTRLSEDDPCAPLNPYGRSKWMVEQILQDIAKVRPFRFCSLRYFNAAGADPTGDLRLPQRIETNLIPKTLRAIREGAAEGVIFGTDYPTKDGTCIRDYVHIADLADAHLFALRDLFAGMDSSIVNLGAGKGASVREVFAAIQKVTKVPLQIREEGRRIGDPSMLVADARRAYARWGWRAHRSDLVQIIADTWKQL